MRDELRTERSGSTSNPENVWSDEHICLLAALAVTALIVYGSLVPFDLRRSEALKPHSWLAKVQSTPWSRMSATDLLVNIAVGMPLGFVLMGAFRAGRRRRVAGAAVAMFAVTCFSAMLGAVLELLQVLSPTRQSSWNDVSFQAIGACVGALAWTLVGRAVIRWLRDTGNERAPGAFAARLLQLYLPVYLLVRLTPFDSGRAVELAAKYREGGVALMPFTQSVDSTFVMLLNLAGNALLTVPIGALAVLGWGRRGTRRPVGWAVLLGLSMVLAEGIAEVLVWGRHADVSELLVGTLGVMIGVAAVSAFPRSQLGNPVGLSRLTHSWVLVAAGVWIVVLSVHSWYPFDFEVTSEIVWERLVRISLVPFGFYYWYATYIVNPLQAVHETLLTFVLAVPLGILLRLAWPIAGERRSRRLQTVATICVATIVLVVIELGQTFLPMRFPDVTDLLIGTIGAMAGIATVTAFASCVGRGDV